MKDSQTRASRNWEKKNPERVKYLKYKSWARSFIKRFAIEEDLKELEDLIKNRRAEL